MNYMPGERTIIRRRAFLALGAGAIGGCIQGDTPGGGGTGQATTTQSESSPPAADSATETERTRTGATATSQPEVDSATTVRGDVGIGIDSDRSEPQVTETISGASGRDQFDDEDTIFVWNDADTARRIAVAVEKGETSGEPLFQETYRFEPDAYVTLDVSKSGEYVVSVGPDGETPETVDFSVDDCNDQSLFVTVKPDGSVRSSGMGTAMGCMTIQPTTR